MKPGSGHGAKAWRGNLSTMPGSDAELRAALARSLQDFVEANRGHVCTGDIVRSANLHLLDAIHHVASANLDAGSPECFAIWLNGLGLCIARENVGSGSKPDHGRETARQPGEIHHVDPQPPPSLSATIRRVCHRLFGRVR